MQMLNLIKSAGGIYHRFRRPVFEAFGSDRYSHLALNGLDRKIQKHLDINGGVFIEAGANDGLRQSNTYWFEKFRGWRGILIEAVPEKAHACRRNRPKATVINAALVSSSQTKSVRIAAADLMAYVAGSFSDPEVERVQRSNAIEVQNLTEIPEIEVAARTLEDILDDLKVSRIDLLSLDVEGYETAVLMGMNLRRYRPRYILVETKTFEEVATLLGPYYVLLDTLSYHDYLFVAQSPQNLVTRV
jgi:FkbM family methyltransferase